MFKIKAGVLMKKDFVGVLQHDEQDCGAACLASLLNYYGCSVTLSEVRERLKVDKSGTNLLALSIVASDYGLGSESLTGSFDELIDEVKQNTISLPFIAHTINSKNVGHFIVVYKISDTAIFYFDPGEGKRRVSFEEFKKDWTQVILCVVSTEKLKKRKIKNQYSKIFAILFSEKNNFIKAVIYSVFVSILSFLGAFFYKNVIDNILGNMTNGGGASIWSVITNNMNLLFILLVILYLIQSCFSFLNAYVLSRIAKKINRKLSTLFFSHIINLPIEFLDRNDSGAIISRYHNIIELQDMSINLILSFLINILMLVLGGIILCVINPLLFLVVTLMIFIYSLVVFSWIEPVKNSNRDIQKSYSETITLVNESLNGIDTIKLQNGEKQFIEKFTLSTNNLSNGVFRTLNYQGLVSSSVMFIEAVGNLIVIWLGSKLVMSGQLSLSSLIVFESLTMYFTTPMKSLISLFGSVQTSFIILSRVSDILSIGVEKISYDNPIEIELDGSIRIDNISFKYNLLNKTLSEISTVIRANKIYGLVGKNGSGKSTLMKIIATLLLPSEGGVYFNDIRLTESNLLSVRKQISYVSQNPYVFEGTLRENLMFGNDVDDEELDEMCKLLDLYSLVPKGNGLGMFILESGSNLSGGQRQKIGLARALLKNPKILLLDEATSSLDEYTENLVFSYLQSLKQKMTVISIFHDSEKLKYVDEIIELDKGEMQSKE